MPSSSDCFQEHSLGLRLMPVFGLVWIFENDQPQLTQHKRHRDELCIAVTVY